MSDGLISRKAAIECLIDALYDLDEADYVDNTFIEEELKKVHAVQPEQKKGVWAYRRSGIYFCSICGYDAMSDAISPYCPNCGAKMEE